ncbi:cell division transport system permease protein [Meinhardsimonia xiamenensis]|uniref:Cell division transport system permease protein n=1 Tax=Meinhardsimonia xiamenensis TaxID=990712 RepID=A0A1G9DXA3_9RHOB|nr:cell division protein FtsX [Meinhardsimonia xiamenensis]PRX31159.1 cell division transport system permease protein [Meinhardsimonia xiamenensis]SDK68449.1 cell division transport system permease protein [Meinhardsimonia xiamenensis]
MLGDLLALLAGDRRADRVVPPTGFTARLTVFASAAMAFLAVFALALSLATGRLAERWSEELARSSTIRISAPPGQVEVQTQAVLRILATTPGVASARALSAAEQRALLEPWFGPDLDLSALPVPQLIDVVETAEGFDAEGLRLRLAAEAPGAVLDDHTRWRRPLVAAAGRLEALGLMSLALIGGATAAMIVLAASAALAANARVIRVLRLVGARDVYIARAFVRRFTLRSMAGAGAGTLAGMAAVALLPEPGPEASFLTGLGFVGAGWLAPLAIPALAGAVAFAATRFAAFRTLKGLT